MGPRVLIAGLLGMIVAGAGGGEPSGGLDKGGPVLAAEAASAGRGATTAEAPAPDFAASLAALLADPGGAPEATWKPALPLKHEGVLVVAGLVSTSAGTVAAYALLPVPGMLPAEAEAGRAGATAPAGGGSATGRLRGTILFVHGYLKAATPFAPLFWRLVGEGYCVVALDLPGHGASYGPRFTVGDFREYGEAVTAVAELCGALPRPLIGLGHSLGGLSLVEAEEMQTAGFGDGEGSGSAPGAVPGEPLARPPARPPFDALLLVTPLSLSSHWPLVRWVAHLPHPEGAQMPFSRVPVSWVLALEAWRERMELGTLPRPIAEVAVTVPAAEAAGPVTVPAVIILGGRDRVIDLADARALYDRLLPEATLYELPWMGHWEIEKRRPDPRLGRLLDEGLAGLGAAGPRE